jgi:hypothetical protein
MGMFLLRSCDVHSASSCSPSCCTSFSVVFPQEISPPPQRSEWNRNLPQDCFASRGSNSTFSLFSEKDYPGKVIMCSFLHLLSTSQYNSRSNRSGPACCYTIMNHLENHLLCAASRYRCRCFRYHRNLYRSFLLLGTYLRLVPTLLISPPWETLLIAMLPPPSYELPSFKFLVFCSIKW